MSKSVYIRPLQIQDALVSYQWRNNPKIWRHTGSRPDRHITPEIETEWLKGVLQRTNEKRYAICRVSDDMYIGNIYLTDMADGEAQIHIFLGDVQFWGKDNAYEALLLLQQTAFAELGVHRIYAAIDKKNLASIALAKRAGFAETGTEKDNLIDFECTREMFDDKNAHQN